MGKDKRFKDIFSIKKEEVVKEIEQKMLDDVSNILHNVGLQNDKYNECWLAGFNYAFERIKKIFELKGNK